MFPPAPLDLATIQAQIIAGIRANAQQHDNDVLTQWKTAVNTYLVNAQHIMELNVNRQIPLPMPDKPNPPTVVLISDAPATDQNHLPISITYTTPPPCPDPPPLVAPIVPSPTGSVQVGVYDYGNHGIGGYWSQGMADAYTGTEPVMSTSHDGVTAKWQKISYPFGGWYIRQS